MTPERETGRAPTVLTVILNYRTAPMTLDSAAAAEVAMAGIAGEIVIVDNESRDGSYEALVAGVAQAGWPRTRVLAAGRNGGYGAGNNVGIRAGLSDGGRPDYVYVLNSDAFPAPDAIAPLIAYLEAHPRAGLAGSHIHGPEGDPHHTAFRFPSIGGEIEGAARLGPISRLLAGQKVARPLPEEIEAVDWLAGASVLMRSTMLDEIGLFDEGFFLYFEETDLCLRARRAGWSTVYVPESRVSHLGSVSTGMKDWARTPRYWFDSRLRYFVKNHGPLYAATATLAHVTGGLIWQARRIVTGHPAIDPPRFLRDMIGHALASLSTRRTVAPPAPLRPPASQPAVSESR